MDEEKLAKEGIPGSSSFSWSEELMIRDDLQVLPLVHKADCNESLTIRIYEGMYSQTRTKEDKTKKIKTFYWDHSDLDGFSWMAKLE